jgi:hypothetical protein
VNDKTTMSWTNRHGKTERRTIKHVIDIRDFRGTPGYSMLVVAANTHLSVADIERFLAAESLELPRVLRSQTWIQNRRWLFQQPGTDNYKPQSDQDGKGAKAREIMAANPRLSNWSLSKLLKEHGIKRSKEWCRRHRGDALSATPPPIDKRR